VKRLNSKQNVPPFKGTKLPPLLENTFTTGKRKYAQQKSLRRAACKKTKPQVDVRKNGGDFKFPVEVRKAEGETEKKGESTILMKPVCP